MSAQGRPCAAEAGTTKLCVGSNQCTGHREMFARNLDEDIPSQSTQHGRFAVKHPYEAHRGDGTLLGA